MRGGNMRFRHSLVRVFAVLAVAAVPATASAATANHPASPPHPVHAKTSKPAPTSANGKAKAYGRYCQGESKRHVAGTKGTPFSQCVTAMAKLANGGAATPKAACASLSKHHVKGMKGTPYSECVKGAAKLEHARCEHGLRPARRLVRLLLPLLHAAADPRRLRR